MAEVDDVFRRLLRAAKRCGVIYLSFKQGTGERIKEGRRFTDFKEENMAAFVRTFAEAEIIGVWQTADARPGRSGELWVDAILRKMDD